MAKATVNVAGENVTLALIVMASDSIEVDFGFAKTAEEQKGFLKRILTSSLARAEQRNDGLD